MKPQDSNQRLLRTGVARNSGRKRTFSNPSGLKLCNSYVSVFCCLRGRDVVGSLKKKKYQKIFLALRFVGIAYVVTFHDVTFQCVAVCCDVLQSEILSRQRQPSSFVPKSAPKIWTQAGSILVERTINQTTEVLLFLQFQLNLDHFK